MLDYILVLCTFPTERAVSKVIDFDCETKIVLNCKLDPIL